MRGPPPSKAFALSWTVSGALSAAEGLTPEAFRRAAEAGSFTLLGLEVFRAQDGWEILARGEDGEVLGHDAEDARAALASMAYAEMHWLAASFGADVKRIHTEVRTLGAGEQRRKIGFLRDRD